MPTFTVLDVSPDVRRFPSQYGEMASYRLHLRNGDGTEHLNVELVRKEKSPAPRAGDEYEGDIENREKHGLKLNLAYSGGGGGGSRPEDPQRQKRIVRQHSQSMALQLLALVYPDEQLRGMESRNLFDLIAKTADWFDNDVEKAAG